MADPHFEAKMDFFGGLSLLPFLLLFCFFSYQRMQSMKSLDGFWRKLIYVCGISLILYNIFCVIRGYSSLFLLKKKSHPTSFEMIVCRVSQLFLDLAGSCLDCALALYWFRKLEVSFQYSDSSLRISVMTSRVMYSMIFVLGCGLFIVSIYTSIKSTSSYSDAWGYQCQLKNRSDKIILWYFWTGWTGLYFLILFVIVYLYASKLADILDRVRRPSSTSHSVRRQNQKMAFLVKKSVMSALFSFFSSSVVSYFDPAYFFWVLDALYNTILIIVQFEFCNDLFLILFCCFIQEGCICRKVFDLSDAMDSIGSGGKRMREQSDFPTATVKSMSRSGSNITNMVLSKSGMSENEKTVDDSKPIELINMNSD